MQEQVVKKEYTKIPNKWEEATAKLSSQKGFTLSAMGVFIYIRRQTLGFNRTSVVLPIQKIMKGTGLTRSSVMRGLDVLKKFNIISIEKDKNFWKHKPNTITLIPLREWNFDWSKDWDKWAGVIDDTSKAGVTPDTSYEAGVIDDTRTGVTPDTRTSVRDDTSYITLKDTYKEKKERPSLEEIFPKKETPYKQSKLSTTNIIQIKPKEETTMTAKQTAEEFKRQKPILDKYEDLIRNAWPYIRRYYLNNEPVSKGTLEYELRGCRIQKEELRKLIAELADEEMERIQGEPEVDIRKKFGLIG